MTKLQDQQERLTGTGNDDSSAGLTVTSSRISVPVSLVLERHIDPGKKWGYPTWRVHSVQMDNGPSEQDGDGVTEVDRDTCHFYFAGFTLEFFRDGGEGYWYNLLSERPFLFVVCDGDYSSREIRPMLVTANQDEANGHMESDDVVLSTPMPPEITALLEQFVVDHYQPEIRHKRKRRDWLEDSIYQASRDGDDHSGGTVH